MWPLHHQHLPFENALLLQSLVDFYFWASSRVFRFHASFILVANIRTRCAVAHTDHQQSLWISEKVVFCLKVDQSIITKLCSFVWHASVYRYICIDTRHSSNQPIFALTWFRIACSSYRTYLSDADYKHIAHTAMRSAAHAIKCIVH